ncbi:TMV resistance protein N [Spatholobus suberectus]|nr:TMV resistance protein N [Spatholobus suberectus]
MPQTEIPEWFDFVGNGGNPRFWARGKFPVFAIAMVFQDVSGRARQSRRQLVELHVVVNGQCVPRKGYYNFRIAADHVLIYEMFDGMLMETMDYEEREDFVDKDFAIEQLHILMAGLKEISTQAKDALESKDSALEDKNSTLTWLLDTINKIDNEEVEPEKFYDQDLALVRLKDKVKAPMDVGEASTSGHHGSEQLEEEIMREIFYDGMTDGLLEAQNSFPSLDIVETRNAALNKGNRVVWSPEGNVLLPNVEMRTYTSGIFGGLIEAKLSFHDLDIWATLNIVASRRGITVSFAAPPTVPQLDWTTVIPPPRSHDPLLQAFMMMKQQRSEAEAESKLFWKLKEEHEALRKKFVQLENAAPDKDSDTARSWKNEYDELIEKLNTQSDELVSKKLDCTDDLKSSSRSSGFTRTVTANVMRRDGLLEAQAILLALDLDRKTEERVMDAAANNENLGVAGIPSPSGPDVDNDNPHRDTYNPSGSQVFLDWQEFL